MEREKNEEKGECISEKTKGVCMYLYGEKPGDDIEMQAGREGCVNSIESGVGEETK